MRCKASNFNKPNSSQYVKMLAWISVSCAFEAIPYLSKYTVYSSAQKQEEVEVSPVFPRLTLKVYIDH